MSDGPRWIRAFFRSAGDARYAAYELRASGVQTDDAPQLVEQPVDGRMWSLNIQVPLFGASGLYMSPEELSVITSIIARFNGTTIESRSVTP